MCVSNRCCGSRTSGAGAAGAWGLTYCRSGRQTSGSWSKARISLSIYSSLRAINVYWFFIENPLTHCSFYQSNPRPQIISSLNGLVCWKANSSIGTQKCSRIRFIILPYGNDWLITIGILSIWQIMTYPRLTVQPIKYNQLKPNLNE